MRQELTPRCLVAASMLAASFASGQTAPEEGAKPVNLPDPPPAARNHFGLSYRMGLNISARFKGLGGYPGATPRGITPSGDPWNYDNGYNLDDAPGTPPGMTWYWGYVNQSQVPGDGFLYLSRSSSASDLVSRSKSDDPNNGFELTYNRDIGKVGHALWGLEGAVNFTTLTIENQQSLLGTVTMQTDAYSTQGQTIPAPNPGQGGYFQPNAPPGIMNQAVVISDTPIPQSTTTIPGGAQVTGHRKLDANVYGFRLGPYLDFPLSEKLSLSFSAGLALGIVDSRFQYNEQVAISGLNPVSSSGSGSQSKLLAGGYVGANVSYALSKSWSALAGVQYQNLGRYKQNLGSKQAELDLSKSVFVNVGFGFSF